MRRQSLIVFVKEPRPGRVKTRLARDVGAVAAAWWLRHRIARLLRGPGCDPRWETRLAIAPDTALHSRLLPPGPRRLAQGGGDLGLRMLRALAAAPPGPALLVGADIPGLGRRHIAEAFALLGRHEAVLGPATDGGFWLIGLAGGGRRLRAEALAGVRWSTPHALADTQARLAPLSVGLAATLADVDRGADLRPGDTIRPPAAVRGTRHD